MCIQVKDLSRIFSCKKKEKNSDVFINKEQEREASKSQNKS